jgi:Flp pilus assembly protein TadB
MLRIMTRGQAERSRPFLAMLGVGVIFFSVGLVQLFTPGRAWLGALVFALGLFWLIVGWYYGRRDGAA